MKKTMSRISIVLLLLGFSLTDAAWGGDYETRTFSESKGDIQFAEIQVEMGLAEITLAAGSGDDLASLKAYYDPEYTEPILDVERDGDKAYVRIETKDRKKRRGFGSKNVDDEYDILLNTETVLQIRAEFGVCESELDLTNLQIERLEIETGVAETKVVLSAPNSLRAQEVKLAAGVSEVETEYLGYLRFDRLSYDGGVGSGVLDFRGFEGEAEVEISVGVGDVEVLLPHDVGVRIYYKKSFLAGVDMDDFDEVRKDVYESEGYDSKSNHIEIDLNVGLGEVDFRWK